MCVLHTISRWKAGVNLHYGRYFGLCRGSGVGRSGVLQRTFPAGDGGAVFRGGLCAGGRWYLQLEWKFVVVMEMGVEGLELAVTAAVLPVWGW